VNYTYLDAQARETRTSASGVTVTGDLFEIQHKPAHRVNAVLQAFLPGEFLLRLEGIYSSSQVERFATDMRVEGFTLFNAQLIKHLGKHLDLYGGVDNVLDEDWEEKLGFPGTGRWGYAGLRARY
jgi:outer membrane cobalamin receptor